MIIKTDKNILTKTSERHIAFPINVEGYNFCGESSYIIDDYWPELNENKYQYELGTVISKDIGDKTLHALVCYSNTTGWGDNQSEIIKECLDKIPSYGENIATYLFGSRSIDVENGADFRSVLHGINDSEQKVILHTDYNMKDIIRFISTTVNRKKYIVTKIEKVKDYVNSDVITLAGNAFVIGISAITLLYFGKDIYDYYNSQELANVVFNIRLQDLNVLLTAYPLFTGIVESFKQIQKINQNLDLKKDYEDVLNETHEEGWTRQ